MVVFRAVQDPPHFGSLALLLFSRFFELFMRAWVGFCPTRAGRGGARIGVLKNPGDPPRPALHKKT